MLRALTLMIGAYPGGRVVAASHGDVIPVLLATLSSAFGIPRAAPVDRGGWYSLRFAPDGLAVTSHGAAPL